MGPPRIRPVTHRHPNLGKSVIRHQRDQGRPVDLMLLRRLRDRREPEPPEPRHDGMDLLLLLLLPLLQLLLPSLAQWERVALLGCSLLLGRAPLLRRLGRLPLNISYPTI